MKKNNFFKELTKINVQFVTKIRIKEIWQKDLVAVKTAFLTKQEYPNVKSVIHIV